MNQIDTLKQSVIAHIPKWLFKVLQLRFRHDRRRLGVNMIELERIAAGTNFNIEKIPENRLQIMTIFSDPCSVYAAPTSRMILFLITEPSERARLIQEAIGCLFEPETINRRTWKDEMFPFLT